MMLLSALCSYCLRPAKCKFFDLYPGNDMPALSARDGSNSRVPSFSRRLSIEYEPRIAGVMLEPPSRSSLSITPRDKIEDPTTVSYFADNFDSLSQIQGQ